MSDPDPAMDLQAVSELWKDPLLEKHNFYTRQEVLKRAYKFNEVFNAFDLYGIKNDKISRDTYLICLGCFGIEGAAIMKGIPPQTSRFKAGLKNYLDAGDGFVEKDDFEVYKSAEALVDEMDFGKPICVLLTVDGGEDLEFDDISVLVVLKTEETTSIIVVDRYMTLPYQHPGDTEKIQHPSLIHRRMTSPQFQLKLSMVKSLFHAVHPKELVIAPLKFYGTIFHTKVNSAFFPVVVMFLISKASPENTDAILDALVQDNDDWGILDLVLRQ